MRRNAYWLLPPAVSAVIAFLVFQALHPLHPPIGRELLRIADATKLPFERVAEDLYDARLVFVGELHEQPSHHEAQLLVIRAFQEAERPVAVGLEMFRADAQPLLDRWVSGEMRFTEFLRVYYDNWGSPWFYYRDILNYARKHRIPLLGLNVPRSLVREVAEKGFDSLPPEQATKLPRVRCSVDETYEEFLRMALTMHEEQGWTFQNFCEAQLAWDAAMAMHLADRLAEHPELSVVVLAGSGHAWKRGIPRQLTQLSDAAVRVILPEVPEMLEGTTVGPGDADYLWLQLPLRE